MKNIERDIMDMEWAIKVFQQCVPEQYRSPISVLIGKYYFKYIPDNTLVKIVSIVDNCDRKKYNTINKVVDFIKTEL